VVQGVLAALVRRGISGEGAHIETSLLEALVDFQFEVLTTYLNDGRKLPKRSDFRSAHAYLSAPYGVYPTADGYLALAMTPLDKLAPLIELPAIAGLDPKAPFRDRDRIKRLVAERIAQRSTDDWLKILDAADIWCAKVLQWPQLLESEGFKVLDMLQTVTRDDGTSVDTTRSPIRVNGTRSLVEQGGPRIGQHTAVIREEFGL
jgi:crotonobetainyl-CoA:carnitine CoA-transferase CaiB-like acyl-CoA transferase